MTRLFFFIALFILAVALSPTVIGEKGYILIAMGDYTIESTVVTAGIFLTLVFIALVVGLKIIKGGLNLGALTWDKLRFASRRKALRNLEKGIAAYVLGDYKQAEHLLVKSAEPSKFEQSAYLMAASAADLQNLPENTKHYLSQLDAHTLESVLISVSLLINHQELAKARGLIDQNHKLIGHDDRLLAQEIKLSLLEKRYLYVVEQLVKARKSKLFSEQQIEQWEAQAFYGAFEQKITDKDQNALHDYWNTLARKVKQRDQVVLAYCKVLAHHNVHQPLEKILLPAIKKGVNSEFIKAIRSLPLKQPQELISAVQKHLHHDQHNAKWLSLMAHLAAANTQWELAEKAFNSLVHLAGEQYDQTDLLTFARVLETLGQDKKALEVMHKLAERSAK